MIRATITLVLALSLCGVAAARTLEILEGAYELALGDVALPSSAAGAAVFAPCEGCDTVRLQVSSRTRYVLGGRELALPDFLVAVERTRQAAGGNESTLVIVNYDLETHRVTRIAVVPPR